MTNLPQQIEEPSRATDEVAEEFKVSGRTVRDAKVVVEQGTEEEQQEVISGTVSQSAMVRHAFRPSTISLGYCYERKTEEFGVIAFEIRKPQKGSLGGRPAKFVYLNEDQSCFALVGPATVKWCPC